MEFKPQKATIHLKYGRESFIKSNEEMIADIEKDFPTMRSDNSEIFIYANRNKNGIKVFKRDTTGYFIYKKKTMKRNVKWIENSNQLNKVSKSFIDFCFSDLEFIKHISSIKGKIKLL